MKELYPENRHIQNTIDVLTKKLDEEETEKLERNADIAPIHNKRSQKDALEKDDSKPGQ